VSGERLAARLEKVTERLAADAPNMERAGADLIAHYLDPDRLPADQRWSRKHAHTQRRLCERFASPVIGDVACQHIKTWHTQQVVNTAPTAGEGDRVRGCDTSAPASLSTSSTISREGDARRRAGRRRAQRGEAVGHRHRRAGGRQGRRLASSRGAGATVKRYGVDRAAPI
jgi:hypothetical protein